MRTTEEEAKILVEFAKKLVESQEDLEPDIAKIVNNHFWELITKNEDLE